MIDQNLHVKVTDFDLLACPIRTDPNLKSSRNSILYGTGSIFISKIDDRADIFSFGVVAYELLLNMKPFIANNFTELRLLIQKERPTGPKRIDPGFPEELQKLLAKALRKDPKDRYSAAKEIIADLDHFINTTTAAAKTIILDRGQNSEIKTRSGRLEEANEEYRYDQDWS